MRVTAAEVMQKSAAPPMAGRPAPRPAGPAAPPASGADPMSADPSAEPGAEPGAMPGEDPTQQQGQQDMQQITQGLLQDYFDDQRIADVSERIQQLIPLVGPEHAEKFSKVYSDWVKSAYVLKANLMSLAVMATPQQVMQNQVTQMMKQLTQQAGQGQAGNPLKVPVT